LLVFNSDYLAVWFEGTLFDTRPDGPDSEYIINDTERLTYGWPTELVWQHRNEQQSAVTGLAERC